MPRGAMRLQKGVWAVAALFAVYTVLYWQHVITVGLPFAKQFSYFAGSCSAICMVLGMLLAARPRLAETAFGGLDRMYRLHKYLGVTALLLFIAHFATLPDGSDESEEDEVSGAVAMVAPGGAAGREEENEEEENEEEEEEDLPVDLFGLIAMIGFTLLIIITLNRKIPYHRWITTHRFMGLFFLVATIHVFLVLYDGRDISFLSAPGLILAPLLLAGLTAYGYRQFFYPKKRKHPFTLAAVNRLERATEVVLQPKKAMFPFTPGQFAFITINAAGFRETHPFTISSGAREDRLRFTMKVLGDYTRRVRDTLSAGADVDIEGPYGRFNPLKGPEQQVWVAGGIGITPFLSVLRTMAPGHGRTIRLYYCVRAEKEALFFSELKERAAEVGGVTITRLASDAGELIDAEMIQNDLGSDPGDRGYYFCGPKPMIVAVSNGLRKQGVAAHRIHKEEFELR